MNRLRTELTRLYLLPVATGHAPAEAVAQGPNTGETEGEADAHGLVDSAGRVRAMVLALAAPADSAALALVWQGVQRELDLPAPAVAVSGQHSCQLWFSLAEPVRVTEARAFLEALRQRYLGDVPAHRVELLPTVQAGVPPQPCHASLVPAVQVGGERWSAFVAPDLAPMFAEEPWLDIPPNPDGQAQLLAGLKSIQPADFQRAMRQLAQLAPASDPATTAGSAPKPVPISSAALGLPVPPQQGPAAGGHAGLEPREFLLAVMRDDTLDLRLRIDAAKALLPGLDQPRQP